jgi:hypothetical protein
LHVKYFPNEPHNHFFGAPVSKNTAPEIMQVSAALFGVYDFGNREVRKRKRFFLRGFGEYSAVTLFLRVERIIRKTVVLVAL